jgi:AbrB family looped-hinge helix DNA binding protein
MKKFLFPRCLGTVTVGERGQVVIPAEARKLLKLKKGDKLMVFAPPHESLLLAKVEMFQKFFKQMDTILKQVKQK